MLVFGASTAQSLSSTPSAPANRVLHLDGTNSYVELPPNIFNNLEEAIVEGWVKWESLRRFSRFFDFGTTWRAIAVCNQHTSNTLYLALGRPPFTGESELRLMVPGLIRTNQWCHIALVTGPDGVRIYFNGALVARDEIRENMFRRLRGDEAELAALWNFDDPNAPGRHASPHAFHGRAIDATNVVASLPESNEVSTPLSIGGVVTDVDRGSMGNATVEVKQESATLATTTTDFLGNFWIVTRDSLTNESGPITLHVRKGNLSCEPIELDAGTAESIPVVS